jgi:hypothetical protein
MPTQAYFSLKGGGFYGSPLQNPAGTCADCLSLGSTYSTATAPMLNTGLWQAASQFHASLDSRTTWSGVPVTIIAGANHSTLAGMTARRRFWWEVWRPETILVPSWSLDGDGTVMRLSVSLAGTQSLRGSAAYWEFPVSHMGLVQDAAVLSTLDELLGYAASTAAPVPAIEPATLNTTQITAYGVARMDALDGLSRHTGPLPGTATSEQSIPGSAYASQADMATLSLADGQPYTVTVMPTGLGLVDITLVHATPTETLSRVLYLGLSATVGSAIQLAVSPSGADRWEVTVGGETAAAARVSPSAAVALEATPPTTVIHLEGPYDPARGYYTGPVTVSLLAEDDPGGAGVQRIEYAFANERRPRLYAGPFVADPAAVSALYALATDLAGNQQVEPTIARIGPERLYLPFTRR